MTQSPLYGRLERPNRRWYDRPDACVHELWDPDTVSWMWCCLILQSYFDGPKTSKMSPMLCIGSSMVLPKAATDLLFRRGEGSSRSKPGESDSKMDDAGEKLDCDVEGELVMDVLED